MTQDTIIQHLKLPNTEKLHCETLAYIIENDIDDVNIMFTAMESLSKIHEEFNNLVKDIDESCVVKGTDSAETVRKKCKKAFKHGVKHYPMRWIYSVGGTFTEYGSNAASGKTRLPARGSKPHTYPHKGPEPEAPTNEPHGYFGSGYRTAYNLDRPIKKKPLTLKWVDDPKLKRDDDDYAVDEAESSTERVRKYYKRHPEKVKAYLRKTVKDRAARNRDRAKAVKKYGKSKMKNHDVHHPNGAQKGNWRLAKKDHGRDKKNESVISEGGAAGHMAHPYEDDTLTFDDMKKMIKRGLIGELDVEGPVTEKLDGQNLTFSVRDGQVVFARNKGHVKNRGKNALPARDLRQKFAGRGELEKSFGGAAEDLQTAVDQLTPEQKQEIFGNGSKFMNLEIIFPGTENVIPYDKSVLVFHGTIEYDEDGKEIGRDVDDGKVLDQHLQAVQAKQQKTFGLTGPKTISFNDADVTKNVEKIKRYYAEIDQLQSEFDLDDKATLEDYKIAWWTKEVDSMGMDWSSDEKEKLVQRWAKGDKQAIGSKDIKDPDKKKFFREYEKDLLKDAQKSSTKTLERVFLRVGADTLKRVTNTLAANNPSASKKLKTQLKKAITDVKEAGDEDQLAMLQQQIERLDDIGIDDVVPTEGVVFIYNGKPYKFTGAFAPVNQILGMMKFQRGKASVEDTKEEPEQSSEKEPEVSVSKEKEPEAEAEPELEEKKTIGIFPGRFQPFHSGHYSIYQDLVDKFGKDDVYIATSDKVDAIKSPFNFNQKKDIITRMFDIPEDKIVQTKQPYRPVEITKDMPDSTTVVMSLSEKDRDRLGGKYFRPYDPDKSVAGFKEHGYIIVAPEMQLNLRGKNISGTQLRHIFGNPQFTDRAKQEIFTMVYGKFDQDIFDSIVKQTTESEEAKKITSQYKDSDNEPMAAAPEGDEELSPKAKTIKSILKRRIRNPKTQRDIYVGTALSYPKDEPVYKAAMQMVHSVIPKNETVNTFYLTENKKLDKMKVYVYTRNYSKKELKELSKEFYKDKKLKMIFPELAKSEKHFKTLIKDAKSKVLSKEDLKNLQNSDVGEILDGDDSKKIIHKVAKEEKEELKIIKNALAEEDDLTMPIAIKHLGASDSDKDDGYYLLNGNAKLVLLAAKGYTIPIKIISYNKKINLQKLKAFIAQHSGRSDKGKEGKVDTDDLFNKIMQMKINNPETGNMIKVDTAMDYDKNHPAHIIARNLIRQRMGGVSSRAGIAKDSGPRKTDG